MTAISVIAGSTRQGRFLRSLRRGFFSTSRKRDGIEARLLDVRDFPMPFFDQALTPAMPGRTPYENKVVKGWTAELAA